MSARLKIAMSRRNVMAALTAAATGLGGGSAMANTGPVVSRRRGPRNGNGNGNDVRCFLAGTRIATPSGERAIEELKVGDLVVTKTGTAEPIRWIGRRSIVRGRDGRWPVDAMPVRVAKGAISDAMPKADLFLSRGHALYIDGLLIPAGDLVNGSTITVVAPEGVDRLEYFHVELARHEIVIAEGMAAESLLAVPGYRQAFDNAADVAGSMVAFAAIIGLPGRRAEVGSRLRSALSPLIDRRQPFDIIRDRIEARALMQKAA